MAYDTANVYLCRMSRRRNFFHSILIEFSWCYFFFLVLFFVVTMFTQTISLLAMEPEKKKQMKTKKKKTSNNNNNNKTNLLAALRFSFHYLPQSQYIEIYVSSSSIVIMPVCMFAFTGLNIKCTHKYHRKR